MIPEKGLAEVVVQSLPLNLLGLITVHPEII